MTRLDDEMDTRILGQKAVVPKWNLEWRCPKCNRNGVVQVQVTGGALDPATNKPTPLTSSDEWDQLIWEAHREGGNLCVWGDQAVLNKMWRWETTDRARGERRVLWLHDAEKLGPNVDLFWMPISEIKKHM